MGRAPIVGGGGGHIVSCSTLKRAPRSSKMAPFDTAHMTFYWHPIVTGHISYRFCATVDFMPK